MSLSALSAGLSGLKANQQALDIAAHNVANVSTEGFQPRQANFQEAAPNGSGVTLSNQGLGLAASEGLSDSGLARDITNSLVYKAGFQLSAKVVQEADQRLGTLIDIKA